MVPYLCGIHETIMGATSMSESELYTRLCNRLRETGRKASGVGIDLGTTKSCLAWAQYDPETDKIECRNLPFPMLDGRRSIALPSAVAQHEGERVHGDAALALRGWPKVLPGRDLFTEFKNLMGLRHTFRDSPDDLSNPTQVAASLVRHMYDTAKDHVPKPARFPLVVTVPASFHGSQRESTVAAARQGFLLDSDDKVRLLDEPCAAFCDLKFRRPEAADELLREGANIMVFDFGGGTCDVALFQIDSVAGGSLGARLRASSRYHRLGGGDIDRAIVHDVLIPQWCEQHGIAPHDLSWHDKRHELEPQLLATAERLKLALSIRLADLKSSTADTPEDLACRAVDVAIRHKDQTLALSCPTLSLEAMNQLLVSILDPEPPPEAGDEYAVRSSIFSPIVHALMRARLEPNQIHGLLLCGSSSLLPQVREALQQRFPDASHVLLGEGEELQGAVARGAALQALSIQVLGEPVVASIASCDVSLKLDLGELVLCQAGDSVPNSCSTPAMLRPPRNSADESVEIAVELLSDGVRSAGRSLWHLPAPVRDDEQLELEWTIDDNQCVELKLTRPDHPGTSSFVKRFDAPIMHRDASQRIRARLLEREERIRNDEIARSEFGTTFEQHARDCAEIGEMEKALHFLSMAMQENGENLYRLNLRGMWRDKMGNETGAIDSYEKASDFPTARFNLALLHHRAGREEDALKWIDMAIDGEADRAYHALRGNILDHMGQRDEARQEWQDAIDGQAEFAEIGNWTLGWMRNAAGRLENKAMQQRIDEYRRSQSDTRSVSSISQGELPARMDAPALLDSDVFAG